MVVVVCKSLRGRLRRVGEADNCFPSWMILDRTVGSSIRAVTEGKSGTAGSVIGGGGSGLEGGVDRVVVVTSLEEGNGVTGLDEDGGKG